MGTGSPLLPGPPGGRMEAPPSLRAGPWARRWERQGRAWLPTSPSGFLLWLGSREPGLSQPNPEASFQDTLGAGPGPTHGPQQEEELRGTGSTGPAPDPRHRARLSQEWAGGGPGRPANTSHPWRRPGQRSRSAPGSPATRLCPDVGPMRTLAGSCPGPGSGGPSGLCAGLPPIPLEAPVPRN